MRERRHYNQTDLGSNSNYAIKSLCLPLFKGLIQMSLDLLAYKLKILIFFRYYDVL